MRRTLLPVSGILAMALVCCASVGQAAYPVRDGVVPVTLLHGWCDGQAAWYVPTMSSDAKFAQVPQTSIPGTRTLTFVPDFAECIGAGLTGEVYLVVNYVQGPVFSSTPNEPDVYTPLWHVNLIIWVDPNNARPITNDQPAGPDNPTGLPSADEASIVSTDVALNCSILATGSLKGAWLPAPEGTYRVPQGIACDHYSKTLLLPAYHVYCGNPITERGTWLRDMIILDAADPVTAYRFGANLSTRLASVPASLMQRLYTMNEPKPMSQFPILRECPTVFGMQNANWDYSSLMLITAMDRHIPLYSVINNPATMDWLLDNGLLTIVEESRMINAPLLP